MRMSTKEFNQLQKASHNQSTLVSQSRQRKKVYSYFNDSSTDHISRMNKHDIFINQSQLSSGQETQQNIYMNKKSFKKDFPFLQDSKTRNLDNVNENSSSTYNL
mmetsp:Transcript_2302/g.2244  ORF Transcript_2302/g.2244 Transcript_2302/m.2244 type:complete len:104 (+) Transcript_2302:3372-3683(+)